MKKQDIISSAALLATSLGGQTAIAGSYGVDDIIVSVEEPAEPELISLAPAQDALDQILPQITQAEMHYTYWGGEGEDVVRVPGTDLMEVTGPEGRSFKIQVNRETREVFTLSGERIDPPRWLIAQLRR